MTKLSRFVKKILAPRFWTDEDDVTDYKVFSDECVKLTNGRANTENISEIWKAAQQDVEHDLRKPALRRELWALAREIEKKIPWWS